MNENTERRKIKRRKPWEEGFKRSEIFQLYHRQMVNSPPRN